MEPILILNRNLLGEYFDCHSNYTTCQGADYQTRYKQTTRYLSKKESNDAFNFF